MPIPQVKSAEKINLISAPTPVAGDDGKALTYDHDTVTYVLQDFAATNHNHKLDDLQEPDDNTDLNASTGKHGLLPKLSGLTSQFLRGDGSWAAASYYEPLTNGDSTSPALVFSGDGDVIMVEV